MAKRFKTWHSSGDSLAKAFLDQQAPRGFISSKNIFFHGPVLYSQWHGNPVAALVRVPGEMEWLITGTGDACPSKETSSRALGRVIRDNGEHGYRHVALANLNDLLLWNGEDLAGYARSNSYARGRANDEKSRDPLCELQEDRVRVWLSAKILAAEKELESAKGTKFATFRKSGAYGGLIHYGELSKLLTMKFGFRLPVVKDIDSLRAKMRFATEAAQHRQDVLAERANRRYLAARAEKSKRPGW